MSTKEKNHISVPAKTYICFAEASDHWLSYIRSYVKESTLTRYHRIVKSYLEPNLKNTPLTEIDINKINGLSEHFTTCGGLRGQALSLKTVTDIICVLKSILFYARSRGQSISDLQGLKKNHRYKRQTVVLPTITRKAIEKDLLLSESKTALGILFALFTGVRIGELCGLKWEDIDFTQSTVTIKRTVERISDLNPVSEKKTKIIISEPKTDNALRVIPIPDFLLNYLTKRRDKPEFYILTNSEKYTEPHQFYMQYKKYMKEKDLNYYSFHALRHTFATRCVEIGFDLKSLSEILGHSSVNTTLSFYVHPTLEQKKRQMEMLTPDFTL